MKLYIKRDVSDEKSRFSVLDSDCKEKYRIEKVRSVFGEKLAILDKEKITCLTIRRFALFFFDVFYISTKNESYYLLLSKSQGNIRCKFYAISWRIRGDLVTKSFDIMDADNTVVATHIKRWGCGGAGCELNVFDKSRELFALAAVTCINTLQTTETAAMQPL